MKGKRMKRFLMAAAIGIFGGLSARGQSPTVVVAEGEKFKPTDENGWKILHQDDSYASHTYGGMWVTHGGVIGAPAESEGSVAVQTVSIPVAGAYRVWSKYQALPYFNYLHKLEILQKGKVVFSHLYGKVDAERFWSFSAGLHRQLWWFWGADHDAAEAPRTPVNLEAGPAEIRLTTVRGPRPAADPMVDFVLLTTELGDTYKGFKPYGVGSPFCLEALEATELYVRFRNTSEAPAQLQVVKPVGHFQPNYGGWRIQIPATPVEPGQWSPWYNLGPHLTLVHNEGLFMTVPGATSVELQFALDSAGQRKVGEMTVPNGDPVLVPIDVTWRKEARVRPSREYAAELVRLARTEWRTANKGRKPREILFYGDFRHQAPWVMELKDALGYNTLLPPPYERNPVDGYHQHAHNEAQIRAFAERLGEDKKSFRILSFGDEIHLGEINWNDPANQEKFTAWLKSKKLTKADLGVEPDAAKLSDRHQNPRLNWYATMFNEEEQFAVFRRMTALAKELIGPQVETGANYSPHIMPQYYGPIYQWVDIFKHNGMTMYWAEDYLFSVPQPPQFLSWMFSTVRCAVKYNRQKIHFYIMPHAPGQIPSFLRRSMVFAVGAGANSVDNFWVAPEEIFTENYVAWPYMDQFRVLHESIFDAAEAEPFQVGGVFRPARVAIVLSKATDHNERLAELNPAEDPFMKLCGNAPTKAKGARRAEQVTIGRCDQQLLYLALRHDQQAVDLITEEDILEGRLKDYDVVYFAGQWIDHRVPPILEGWVRNGGVFYACAGLGHRNEFDEPEQGLLNLLGLKAVTYEQHAQVIRPMMELPLIEPVDTIQLAGEGSIGAVAVRQELTPDSAEVIGTWSNGKPAVTVRTLGKGKAFAVGTAAGHSYYKTGLKPIPWARGGRKTVYNPTGFASSARTLALLGVRAREVPRPVVCSNSFVEGLVLDNAKGTLLTLVNWDNEPLKALEVRVSLLFKPTSVRSVQQQKNLDGWTYDEGVLRFATDLEWADFFLIAR